MHNQANHASITSIMLQKGWDSIKEALVSIVKASFLFKPGKDDFYNPKSYRTITLAPVPLKWMEVANFEIWPPIFFIISVLSMLR